MNEQTDNAIDEQADEVEVQGDRECDCCGWVGNSEDLDMWIKDIHERVSPGDIMPEGECPECGACVHIPTSELGDWLLELCEQELTRRRAAKAEADKAAVEVQA